ncbi:hypothetical protein BDB00DRAFT_871714 [Zychaea mexicana]|uniref:uncharacterized protein n=1 Tax=Zychaea mexicana TaxID=64656 RepID=UPI0022FE055F|nr:uncharacterized protein BDB00DRAFT_871714 [Zychaea mexicana]KAI9494191.1 hypothetical protein BDB00DRAFT_871714 [Zychaea mexicana]
MLRRHSPAAIRFFQKSFQVQQSRQPTKLVPSTISFTSPSTCVTSASSSVVSDLKLTRYHLGRLWQMLYTSFQNSNIHSVQPYNERICLLWPDSMRVHISSDDLSEFYESITSPSCATVCANVSANLSQVSLGQGAQRVLTTPTGGKTSQTSTLSEALSVELLTRLLGSNLTKTETELEYTRYGPMTDYACRVQDSHLGVSVTRAMSYWRKKEYTRQDAVKLLTRKLRGILESSENIANASFDKQILHVLAMSGHHAAQVKRACKRLSQDLKSDTIIFITTVKADSVFFNSNRHLEKMKRSAV